MSRPSFSSDFFPSIHRCFTFATDHVKYSPLPSAINSSNNFHQFPADGPMTEGLRSLPPVPGSTIGFDNQRSGNFFNYLDFFTCRVLKKTNNKIRSDKRSTSSLAVVPASFHFCLIWLFFISLFFIFHFFFCGDGSVCVTADGAGRGCVPSTSRPVPSRMCTYFVVVSM